MEKKMSRREMNVYRLLCDGKKSVTDITMILGYSDPRGYFRNLRNKQIPVCDEWVRGDDTRFKVYWVEAKNKGGAQ